MQSLKTILVHRSGWSGFVRNSFTKGASPSVTLEAGTNLTEVTSQPLATADLHIREPRNPLPPQTTNFLAVAMSNRLSGESHEVVERKHPMSSMFCFEKEH